MPFNFQYIILGACVGFIVGLTGIGGCSLMTPALVLLFGIHPVTAVGIDLLYAAMTKSAGSIVHALRRTSIGTWSHCSRRAVCLLPSLP